MPIARAMPAASTSDKTHFWRHRASRARTLCVAPLQARSCCAATRSAGTFAGPGTTSAMACFMTTTIQRGTVQPPVHALSALALAFGDWLAMGFNIVTAMDAYWPVSVGSALLAALAIFFIERQRAQGSQRAALIKAACAVPLIVLPFPLAGSVVGLAFLVWALVSWLMHRS